MWLIEHHFSDYFPTPSPLILASHIAGRFPELSLGTCVVVLPWYEPLRLAGEIAMLSLLMRAAAAPRDRPWDGEVRVRRLRARHGR